jgi:hypothetical protein
MAIGAIFGFSGALLLLHPLSADFKVDGVPPAIVAPPPIQLAPQTGQPDEPPSPRLEIRPQLILATGFGRDVPLDFAVHQLVPHSMHIEYANAVDRQIRVSWQGGKPWQDILHTVLMPLGLQSRITGHTVRITE